MTIFKLPGTLKKLYKHWRILQQIRKQYHLKDWLGCITCCNKLIEAMENDFFGYYYRGICNVKLKLYQEAISDLELSKANLNKNRSPKHVTEYEQELELRLANIFRLNRDYNSALTKIDELLNKFPDYVNGYKERAGIYVDLDNLKLALEATNKGLEYDPKEKELEKLRNSLIYDLTNNIDR